MAGGTGKDGGPKTGKGSGHAPNAALQSDEDMLSRRTMVFGEWKSKKLKKARTEFMEYANSPTPPKSSFNRS